MFLIGIGLIQGQDYDQLESYLGASNTAYQTDARQQISKFVDKLNSKTKKSDRKYLLGVFTQTHRQFLKEYRQYSSFTNIFEDGTYDCVTATALYSLLLTELGFEYEIVETKYHIFILVDSPEGQMLIESTDPINGFEYQQERIDRRIAQYLTDNELSIAQLNTSKDILPINSVTPFQLTGLLYYNQCVKQFNENQLRVANNLLSKARHYYDSPRMSEMENILRNQMVLSKEEIVGLNPGRQVSQRQQP